MGPVGDEVRMVLTKRKGHFGMVKCYRDKWYFTMIRFCHIMIIMSHPFWWKSDDHCLIWCREACVVFHQMVFFSPGRVIACISWLHCSATLLCTITPAVKTLITHGQNVNVLRDSPKTCPPKKHGHPICFFYGLIWIVRFEEFNSTNLFGWKCPSPRCWEMVTWNLGHLGLEFLKFFDGLESRVDPVKYEVNQRNLIEIS